MKLFQSALPLLPLLELISGDNIKTVGFIVALDLFGVSSGDGWMELMLRNSANRLEHLTDNEDAQV